MSIEDEIPTIYEVRPKKHPTTSKTHHWKLRIETLKSQNDIRRVEFILHDTFPEPIQVKKKSPFEIEEDGFGNFEMKINIKILNRKIPLPYFIHLSPQKVTEIRFHHSVWMVKTKELSKVLEIGGIPVEKFENNNTGIRELTQLLEYVETHSDRPLDPSMFYPKVYEKVLKRIRRLENSKISSSFMCNPDNEAAYSDDSSSTRQSHGTKSQVLSKHNLYDSGEKLKAKIPKAVNEFMSSPKFSDSYKASDFEMKKEMKRKKIHYDSSSESDINNGSENFVSSQKRAKIKSDDFLKSSNKQKDLKMEKASSIHRSSEKVKTLQKPDPPMKMENIGRHTNKLSEVQKPQKLLDRSNQKHLKDLHKSKLNIKESSNSDNFNKLFEVQDILVVNRNKANLSKHRDEYVNKRIKQESNAKVSDNKLASPIKMIKEASIERQTKNAELFGIDNGSKKNRPMKLEEKIKDSAKYARQSSKSIKPNSSKSSSLMTVSKMKLPEKTLPDQKKQRETEIIKGSPKNFNSNAYSRGQPPSSSSGSDRESIFSKSSSDNEIDHEMFKPKKKMKTPAVDPMTQLFGDDNSDASDDDNEQADDVGDIFSSLNKSDKKNVQKSHAKQLQHQHQHQHPHQMQHQHLHQHQHQIQHQHQQKNFPSKAESENSSDNEPIMHKENLISRSPSTDNKCERYEFENSETTVKGCNTDRNQRAMNKETSSNVLSYKERRRLAKQLIKINDKTFYENLQHLLLTSYRNKEKSLSLDFDTMKLDFHMGEISNHLANIIKSMVDEFYEEHHSSSQVDEAASSHGF